MLEFHTGDLLSSDEYYIGHGCNALGVMGAGIARQIRDRYPSCASSFADDIKARRTRLGGAHFWLGPNRTIVNLVTQPRPGPTATLTAIGSAFGMAAEPLHHLGSAGRIAIPRIGAGYGGLRWDDVADLLAVLADELDLTIAVYTLP